MLITTNASETLNQILPKTAKSIRRNAYELSRKYLDGKKNDWRDTVLLNCALLAARPKPASEYELKCVNRSCRDSGPGPALLGDTLSYACPRCGVTWMINGMSDAKFIRSWANIDKKKLRDWFASRKKDAKMRKQDIPQPRPRVGVGSLDSCATADHLKVIHAMAPTAYMALVRHGMEIHGDYALFCISRPTVAKRLLQNFLKELDPEQVQWPYIREFISSIRSSATARPNQDPNFNAKWVL